MSLLAEGGNPKSKGGTAVDVFVTESVKEVIDEMLNERKSLVDVSFEYFVLASLLRAFFRRRYILHKF